MKLKEYRQVYDKVSLSKEADERILQALTEKIPDSTVKQQKKRKRVWIARIAKIAGMAAMIAIPILAMEMMRLSSVTSIEKNVDSKVNDLIKNVHGGREYGYPTSIYVYNEEEYNEEKYTVSTSADYPEYESADALVDVADLIFSGTVKEFSHEASDDRTEKEKDSETDIVELFPYTIFEISVDQVYKGSIDEDTIHIKWPEDWQPEDICIGGTYLFLTKTYENSYPSPVNLTQSVYNMEDTQGEETVSDCKDSNQDITLSDILERVLDRKEQSNGQTGIGYGGQEGTPAN